MQRRLLPGPLWSAITIFAIVIVSIALAVLSPALRTQSLQSLSPVQGAAVAAAPDDSQHAAEGPSQVAPEAQSGAAASQAPSNMQVPSNRWGANYFPNLPVVDQNGRT